MQELIKNSPAVIGAATSGRRARVGWLVLLALATLQFAFAQHSSAHEIADLAESCQFCIQHDDNLPAADEVAPATVSPVPAAVSLLPTSLLAAHRYPRAGRSRAPPIS